MHKKWVGFGALAASLAMIVSPIVVPAAMATNYPSWQDVLDSRNNVAQKEKQINILKQLLKNLQSKLEKAVAGATTRHDLSRGAAGVR